MSGGAIIAIIVIAVIIVGIAGAAAVYGIRQQQLRRRFGPEYDRLVEEYHSRRKAEAELTARQRHVRDLDIRPLEPAARARYAEEWVGVQEWFVDSPQRAVADAQRLVMTVMNERGYPTEQDSQMLADLSVDHAAVLDHYRAASAISKQAVAGTASTEDLRQALIHYRALFQELLGEVPETGVPVPPEDAAPITAEDTSPDAVAPVTADETAHAPPPDTAPAAPEDGTPAEAERNGERRRPARTVQE